MKRILPRKKSSKSQVIVIITFIIAALMASALVFVNIAKISDIKTMTAIAADKSALGLGSSLGTMSNVYLQMIKAQGELSGEFPNPGPYTPTVSERKVCAPNWMMVIGAVGLLIGLVLTIFSFGVGSPILAVVGAAVGGFVTGFSGAGVLLEVNTYMKEGAYKILTEMSLFSSYREATLLNAVQSLPVTDTVVVTGGGGSYSDGTYSFDLSKSPIKNAIKNKSRIPRFVAWYYDKRFKLVSETELATAIQNDLIGYMMDNMYFAGEDWSSEKWQYQKISLPVDAAITCSGNLGACAADSEWITPASHPPRRVIAIGPVALDDDSLWFLTTTKGFLGEKFPDLCHRLIDRFDPHNDNNLLVYGNPDSSEKEYISRARLGGYITWLPWDLGYDDGPIHAVAEDLRGFMIDLMVLANTPISERLSSITSWLRLWYDWDQHSADGSSVDSDLDDDVYERLQRVTERLTKWIDQLNGVNQARILPDIKDWHGSYCLQGRGDVVEQCFTNTISCYCHHEECTEYECHEVCDGDLCTDKQDARWAGDYATCTGTGNDHSAHPVCSVNSDLEGGDLYAMIPAWCSQLRSDPCISHDDDCSSCEPPENHALEDIRDSFYFQGQYAWNNDNGPSEVDQAIEILQLLKEKLDEFRKRIKQVADKAKEVINNNDPVKNELVYCWNDVKPGTRTNNGVYHLVRVKIEGYPKLEDFPYIVQTREYANFLICKEVKGQLEGSFTITVSRYDTDLPGFWWKMRRRQLGEGAPQDLSGIESTIMTSGQGDGGAALSYAIESKTRGTYGPAKSQITITREK